MNRNVRFAAGLALLVSASGMSGARAQAPQSSQGSPAVTFQVEVDYVDVDVVVTDQQGNFVRGLTRDDFEVFEDGKPVKIDTFSTVEIPVAALRRRRVSAARRSSRTFGPTVRCSAAAST